MGWRSGWALFISTLLTGLALGAEPQQGPSPHRNKSVGQAITIPWLDLAHDPKRLIVVDRQPGVYLGHPSLALLGDGPSLLVVYPRGHGRGPILMKRSDDGGRTWSERLPVPENWATSQETPTLYRVLLPQGSTRLLLFSGLYPIRMARSEDLGRTWTPLEPIGSFGGVVAMSDLELLRDGTLMAVFHDDGRFLRNEGKPTGFTVYRTLSRDGGLTWSEPEPILKHPEAHLCEPCLVRSPDGTELACLMRENSRRYHSMVSFSQDEGRTWCEPVELPAAVTGDRHVACYASDGRLLVVFRDMAPQSPTRGDLIGWVGRYEDLRLGREGQYRVRLLDHLGTPTDTGYAGLTRLSDGTFLAVTYGILRRGEYPEIVATRFRLEELDALLEAQRAYAQQEPSWQPLWDGQSLKNWNVTRFGGEGEVYVKEGCLVLEMGEPLTGVTWAGPALPTQNYEVELEASRWDGHDFFCGLTFPVGENPCTLILGGWGGSVVGLSSLDGLDASENETSTSMSFQNRRWYHIRLRVSPVRIQAWVDDKRIIHADIRGRRIGIRPEVELSRPFGLASYQTTAAIRNLRIRRLSDSERLAELQELNP